MSPAFKSGDLVVIDDDIQLVKLLQEGHGGWNDEMGRALGWKGKVLSVYGDGNLCVEVNGATWTFNPECCTLASEVQQPSQQPHGNQGELVLMALMESMLTMSKNYVQKAERQVSAGGSGSAMGQRQERLHTVVEGACDTTALHAACRRGDTEVVRNYLSIDADIKTKDSDGNTALHHAALGASAEIIRLLLTRGAAINERNSRGCTALHLAVIKQCADGVSNLLEYNCDVNIQDGNGNIVLHTAVEQNNTDIISKLVDHGCANYGINNDLGFNVLQHAVSMGNVDAVKKLLPVTEHLIDLRNVFGLAPLHIAAAYGFANAAAVLIEEGRANMELRNGSHQTPFLVAVFHGNQQAADCLLECGADMQAKDDEGNTCLHYAVAMCGSHSGETEFGADLVTGVGSPGYELLLYLLNRGADISAVNNAGKSVLELAPSDCVRQMLLEYIVSSQAAAAVENVPRASASPTRNGNDRAGVPSANSAELERLRQLEKDTTCPICMDQRRNTAFGCGHTVCRECSSNVSQCPVCRTPVACRTPFFM